MIIVGSGPAGYTAAIYLGRAGFKPLVIAGALTPGGQLVNTTEVENFPGFPDGVMGPELMDNMQRQAEKFGAEIVWDDVVSVSNNDVTGVKTVSVDQGDVFETHALIIATGSEYRKLDIPGEAEYSGKGVSYCATCDGFFFRGKEVVVVMGVGFVGAVMAAIVADCTDRDGRPSKFVIGCQRPSTRSFWKIPLLNRGVSPVKAEDPQVDVLIGRCVNDRKTLTATYNSQVIDLADCVVIDVQCDFLKQELGNMKSGECDMAALEATLKTVGQLARTRMEAASGRRPSQTPSATSSGWGRRRVHSQALARAARV